MKPAEVPAGFVDLVVEVFEDQAHEHCNEDGCPGQTRPYHEALTREALADLLPEHERQVREQVSGEILADVAAFFAARVGADLWEAAYRAARVARGGA